MAKTVGLSRNIKMQWLNKAVALLYDNLEETEYKSALNEYLGFEIGSVINIRKTREILMHLWFYKDDETNDIRELGLSLIRAYPDYALPIHWCMILITYPVFADVCKLIGRISDFQEEITLAQLKQKLFDEWGERTTLFHSTDKIIMTMKDMGVLSCEKPGKYHIQKYPISNEQIVNYMLLVAMKVGGNSYYTLPDLTNIGVLFPFEYRVNKEQLITDDHFVINNFGGEITVALK
ncbi:MAG: hypothetical protein LKE88_02200 [Acidaminococcus provencensis]|jgi:hypothetical protein|uniref:hypothetical protein n=1 Tax=Acidaminococcus provencensis TaxID=2058289 RepID=UPI0023F1F806|nr:hypothetical protein [Acidaminococcus provencensis]MCH4095448.1 hypothetical protein [Acidaminococcus provencensis]